jgi:hypothetical protein
LEILYPGHRQLRPSKGRQRLPLVLGTSSKVEVADVRARIDARNGNEWRDVRAIRESDDRATSLAAYYGASETLIRRICRNESWVTQRPREAVRLPAVATLLWPDRECLTSAASRSRRSISPRGGSMRVYQQVLDMGGERLPAVVGKCPAAIH